MSKHAMNLEDTIEFLRATLKDLPRGQIADLARNNPNINYPTINRFKNGKLPYVPKKLVVDCLSALGYKNIKVDQTITISFDN